MTAVSVRVDFMHMDIFLTSRAPASGPVSPTRTVHLHARRGHTRAPGGTTPPRATGTAHGARGRARLL